MRGLPLHLSRVAGAGRPLARHVSYLLGKTFTYVFLGALAGLLGHLLVHSQSFSSGQNLLAYTLGGVMVVFGLAMLGLVPTARLPRPRALDWRVITQIYGHFFRSPGPQASLLFGVATGFLPCPVTFAMMAAAAATYSVRLGMITMLGLGLGTMPVLLGIGLSGTLLDARLRRIGLRGAGAIVIVLGLITLLRPTGLMHRVLPHASHAHHSMHHQH